jgi:5-methylcytosine-specific restriction endonuclease McrA
MPKSSPTKLRYMSEYQKKPENVEKRVDRNRVRRQALAAGTVKKGDGTEIDHKVPLDKGGSDAKGNTRVTTAAENRAWRGRQPEMYGKGKK